MAFATLLRYCQVAHDHHKNPRFSVWPVIKLRRRWSVALMQRRRVFFFFFVQTTRSQTLPTGLLRQYIHSQTNLPSLALRSLHDGFGQHQLPRPAHGPHVRVSNRLRRGRHPPGSAKRNMRQDNGRHVASGSARPKDLGFHESLWGDHVRVGTQEHCSLRERTWLSTVLETASSTASSCSTR